MAETVAVKLAHCNVVYSAGSALSVWQMFDSLESGLKPGHPPKAQLSSTPPIVEVGEEVEEREETVVAAGEGERSRGSRKRQRDDGGSESSKKKKKTHKKKGKRRKKRKQYCYKVTHQ